MPHDMSHVCLLALDFDGVMTDNRVLVDQNGKESVWCNRGDGWGIARLKDVDIEVVVLSTETNPVVAARCRKLGIECFQGCNDKLARLQQLAQDKNIEPGQIAYVGNDLNDLECLKWVGFPVAVADSIPSILPFVKHVTLKKGGDGAVREVCDRLLAARDGDKT